MAVIGLGLSGGVDSTMAAYLLQKAGHQVKGFSLRLGSGPDLGYRQGAISARDLGICHQVVDVRPSFREKVLRQVAPGLCLRTYPEHPAPCATP